MRNWVWPIAMGMAIGCAPKGKPPAVPASLKSSVGEAASAEREKKAVPLTGEPFRQGLPPFCDIRHDETASCVVCQAGDLPLERCFPREASFDAHKSCVFDKHHLKCLVTEQLAVVKLPFEDSPEKQVMSDIPVIFSSIKAIVENSEQKQPEEAALLFTLLDFVQAHRRAIILGEHTPELARQLSKALGAHGGVMNGKMATALEAEFVAGVGRLRAQAVQGHLKASDSLQFVRDLALPFVQNEKTAHMLKTMNVDGLASISG